MALTAKAVGWHVGSVAAGAVAMLTFTASHSVDVYAIFDQLNATIAAISKLVGMVAPFAAAGAAGYRTWGAKQVPTAALVVDVGSPSKAMTDEFHPPGNLATVTTAGGVAAAGRVL